MTQRRWSALAGCVAMLALVAGCQTQGGGSFGASGERDRIVTQSDEPAFSKRARVRLELASAYYSRGQFTTALDEVKQALVADPNLGEAYNLRGLIYSSLNEPGFAEESYRRALQLNSRDGDTMHNLGWFLCQQRRYEDGDALFVQALALPQYQGGTRTLLARGVCQARAGQWAQAEINLSRAYELDPTNPATAVNLSEVLLRRGNSERARFYIRRVNATTDQSNAQTLWLASRIEMKLGNRQGANEFGQQLRDRFPQSPEALAYQKGQFDE
jgi:type IV pilus assembly protein PilF